MKAILKSTGEIIDSTPVMYRFTDEDKNYLIVNRDEVEILEHDWAQVRVQASIAAMQGLCANKAATALYGYTERAEMAVKQAEALIEQLKKK